jgi:hypothetical protein
MSNTTREPMRGCKGQRDLGLSSYGPFLYALDADSGHVCGWSDEAKALTTIGSGDGLPLTAGGHAVA